MHPSVAWLYGLQHFGVKLGLDNVRGLLDLLGNPQRAFPALHVAGTNGKGSVAAMIDALLGAHGLRTGLFTSPHLVRPNERIRIGGTDLGSDELHARLDGLRATIEAALAVGRLEDHPSFFEVITAAAFGAFADARVDAAVVEVGLGGRLDATNVLEPPVGAIVSVGLDHTKALGGTLDRIAFEKAGIVKPGMTVVSGVTDQVAIEIVRRACEERGARFVEARAAVELVAEDERGLTLRSVDRRYEGIRLALAGRHQIGNAQVAIACLEAFAPHIGLTPDVRAVARGLATVRWPGRLQWIDRGSDRPPLLVDGAHNPDGVAALAAHLARSERPRPVLLFGATEGRPVEELAGPIAPFVRAAVTTRPPVERGVDASEAGRALEGRVEELRVEDDPDRALEVALGMAEERGTYLLVTGSLYLVGHVLGRLEGGDGPGPVPM